MTHATSNRRSETRSLTSALIALTDRGVEMPAVLEDLSPSGACLYVDRKLDIGSRVSLTVGEISCVATVKHIEAHEDIYYIGVQFQNGKWPEPIGVPIHWVGLTSRQPAPAF
jgi:hypothetical protein